MSRPPSSAKPPQPPAPALPVHWTPEQALAVAECLQVVRQALWSLYGPQMQQDWRDQLMLDQTPPEFDPDEPF